MSLFVMTVTTFKVYQGLSETLEGAKKMARAEVRCRFRRSKYLPNIWEIWSTDWKDELGNIRQVELDVRYSNGLDGQYPGGRS